MTEKLELLCVKIAGQSLLVRLHVKNVEKELTIWLLGVARSFVQLCALVGVKRSSVDTERGCCVRKDEPVCVRDVTLENFHPQSGVLGEYILEVILLAWHLGDSHLVRNVS